MELLNPLFKLNVKKLRGADEFEIYKNYIHDLPRERITHCLTTIFEEENIQTKDDNSAIRFRQQGNRCYVSQNYKKSLNCYTKSLCYATCNGEQYSLAFANRAAAYFSLEQYQSCISDINLCLQANYPVHLQPKVYLRKARCLQKLGQLHEMRKILVDALNLIDGFPAKLKTDGEKYKQTIKDLIIAAADGTPVCEKNFEVLPYIEPNSKFPNASASIFIKCSKQRGSSVIAKKDIAAGEVLFFEKAYAFAPKKIDEEHDAEIHCQYCLLTLKSCVPCKTCTEHLYCNDNCRDCAWKEFHQWECLAVQADFKTCCGDLAFRIILKALHTGFAKQSVEHREGSTENDDKEDKYTYVYNLPFKINKMAKETLDLYVGAAGLLVNYLKWKTDFFHCMKQLPQYSKKNDDQLMTLIGGLMLRHSCQYIAVVPVWDFDNDYYVPQEITIADAMCPLLKNMEHSCMPNTGHYFIGDTIVVKAITNIKNKQKITRSVGGMRCAAMEKAMRRYILEKLFMFKCTCQLCMDPRMDAFNSYKCIKCEGRTIARVDGNIFLQVKCTCLECNHKFILPFDFAAKTAFVFDLLPVVPHYLDVINDCIRISKTIFTPFHGVFVVLYTAKADYYKRTGDVDHFLENVKLLLHCEEIRHAGPAVKIGRDSYTNCVIALDMLQTSVKKTNLTLLRKVLKQLTAMLDKSKAVFNLHHAPFLARLQTVEKKLRQLESSYSMPGADEK